MLNLVIVVSILFLGLYFREDLLNSQYGIIVAIMSALAFPSMIFLRLYMAKKRGDTFSKISEEDREQFSKIEGTKK